jgi:hypothetical protein
MGKKKKTKRENKHVCEAFQKMECPTNYLFIFPITRAPQMPTRYHGKKIIIKKIDAGLDVW